MSPPALLPPLIGSSAHRPNNLTPRSPNPQTLANMLSLSFFPFSNLKLLKFCCATQARPVYSVFLLPVATDVRRLLTSRPFLPFHSVALSVEDVRLGSLSALDSRPCCTFSPLLHFCCTFKTLIPPNNDAPCCIVALFLDLPRLHLFDRNLFDISSSSPGSRPPGTYCPGALHFHLQHHRNQPHKLHLIAPYCTWLRLLHQKKI